MNDELIERLAELLEYKGPLQRRDRSSPFPDEKLAIEEAKAMHSLIGRIRFLIGASSDTNDAMVAAMLRRAIK